MRYFLAIEEFPSLVLPMNAIMSQYQRAFSTFKWSLTIGGRSQMVLVLQNWSLVAYERRFECGTKRWPVYC